MPTPTVRAGDRDRDSASLELRDHCAAGRLSLDELEERVARVYAASTRQELDALLADLPRDAPPSRARRRALLPGIRPFNEQRRLAGSCQATYDAAMRQIVPRMGIHGYQLVTDVRPHRMRFVDDRDAVVTVLFLAADGEATDVCAFGHAPRAIRRAFATLSD